MVIMGLASTPGDLAMRKYEITYLPVDKLNSQLGPYIVTALWQDDAIDKVIAIINRECPEVNLERNYNRSPHVIFEELPNA
jgi:hypothetical protein